MKRTAVKKTAAKKAAKGAASKVVKKKAVKKAVKKTAAKATTAKTVGASAARAKVKSVVAKKSAAKRKAAPAKSATKKKSVNKAVRKPAAQVVVRKPLLKRATKSSARKTTSTAPKRKAASAKKLVSSRPLVNKSPAAKSAKAKTPTVQTAARKVSVPDVRKTALPLPPKPTRVVATKPAALAARPRSAAPVQESPDIGPVSPEIAVAHFQELLRAKQERVRQGPTYPAANPYTGRHDVAGGNAHGDVDSHGPPSPSTPEPEAVYGASTTHGRGNQGMRKPK